jgi:hypothetical protein
VTLEQERQTAGSFKMRASFPQSMSILTIVFVSCRPETQLVLCASIC